MKILHIIAQLPSKTGSGVYFSNLIKELNKNNENYATLIMANWVFILLE